MVPISACNQHTIVHKFVELYFVCSTKIVFHFVKCKPRQLDDKAVPSTRTFLLVLFV